MAAQRGKDILLKIEGDPGVFTTVAGLRARTLSLNARTVDATDGDSAGRWRELLGGAGDVDGHELDRGLHARPRARLHERRVVVEHGAALLRGRVPHEVPVDDGGADADMVVVLADDAAGGEHGGGEHQGQGPDEHGAISS